MLMHRIASIASKSMVHSDCYNTIPQIGWLINNRNVLLAVLEAEKANIKAPTWSPFAKSPLSGS